MAPLHQVHPERYTKKGADKHRKQAKKRESSEDVSEVQHSTKCRPSWIPWLLLISTWLGIGLYWLDSAGVLL